MGVDKYPILYWNNPSVQNNLPLTDLRVAHFFFKSAHRVLESQKQPIPDQKSRQATNAGASGNRKD